MTLASSKSLKLLPILGVPSLPSFAIRLCLGESVERGLCCGGRFCDWGCDCTDDEDEWAVCVMFGALGSARGGGGGRCEGGRFGDILTVELGSVEAGGVTGRRPEKGRKGGDSSSSSSASDRGLRGALEEEYRGRRAYARLRDIGCGASSDEEEDEDESLATADGLASLRTERCCCFGDASTDLPEASRLRAKEECFSVGVRGDAGICVTVWVDAVRDIGRRTVRGNSVLVSPRDVVRSFALCDSDEGTRDPPLPPLVMAYPPAVPLPDIELGVGDAPDESLFAFCSPALTWDICLS